MEYAIEFEHISKSYTPEEVVLRDINLAIQQGEFVVLLGQSGCGKTTLLKMVNNLLDFDAGYLRIHGKKLSDYNIEELRRSIGYAIQQVGLFPHMRVWENVSYVLKLQGVDIQQRKERAERLLELVGLKRELLMRYPRQLSGGQKQRVGVARALAANPSIMLMDEPFGAVDEQTRTQLQDQLKQIHRKLGQTIVFVTHDIREAFRLGTRIVLIHHGSIVQEGTAEDLVFRPKTPFVRSFLGRQGFSALFDEAVLDKLYERVGQGKLDMQACLALLEQKKSQS